MAFENAPLKYLFKVFFEDGSSIDQTPEDVSTIDPTKSAFHDVLQSGKSPIALVLREVGTGVESAVSLIDGHFEIDGNIFFSGDAPDPGTRFELIYFRRNFRDFNVELDQVDHRVHYYLGWRAAVDGRSIEKTVGLV